ncbi:hypothetical protein CEXT_18391 [Caerostris extrusa]|uniref:Uncharacterized protein n=1 Tax=Caerostris extrusa TaxID=172846 RepID=A0AAV4Y4R7_CAEEX|nr:hypothetical protein CEXT_18391 [Caerostris extrusa]
MTYWALSDSVCIRPFGFCICLVTETVTQNQSFRPRFRLLRATMSIYCGFSNPLPPGTMKDGCWQHWEIQTSYQFNSEAADGNDGLRLGTFTSRTIPSFIRGKVLSVLVHEG